MMSSVLSEDTRDLLLDWLGIMGIALAIFLSVFGSWVWGQDSISERDSRQNQEIAVLQSRSDEHSRRITSIEDRLFGLLLTAGGAVAASGVSAMFSFRIHRHLKNGQRNG